jgi:iron complex transport system permease protein
VQRERIILICLVAGLIAVTAFSMLVGTCGESFWPLWRQLSLPRLVMGMLAGAGLSVAGAMFQSLFRNPLASPYTLGISSGASLGATVAYVVFRGGLWHGFPVLSPAAFAGAAACVFVVYSIARMRSGRSLATLLLAGITIGFVCSALIVLLLFFADQHDLALAVRWMMGSLDRIVGFDPVYESVAMLAVAAGVAVYFHRDLDLMMMGETVAAARGVAVRRARWMVYFAASLLTAGVVAHCGPIGFVGLLIPHIMRFFVGPVHAILLPACALAGAAYLPLCDVLARNTMWWLEGQARQVPVGVLTNLVGGGFFLYVLLTRRADRPGL